MDKYVAYEPMNCEYETFDTLEEAQAWLLDQDWSEGIAEEYEFGYAFIAKITHRTAVKKTDSKENYPCVKFPENTAVCTECEWDCEGAEEWPYDNSWDWVGDVILKEVE